MKPTLEDFDFAELSKAMVEYDELLTREEANYNHNLAHMMNIMDRMRKRGRLESYLGTQRDLVKDMIGKALPIAGRYDEVAMRQLEVLLELL
jgi:hypothetical protein